jgi:magnesium chelatase family protein
MYLAIINSRASSGIKALQVTVEVHLSNGLPSLSIVGLPETAVKESKDRVRSAIINSKFEFPIRRIVVNLAPADLPKKDGGRFDLAIAIGVLAASGQIPMNNLDAYEFAGELALSGKLRPINGVLPFALATKQANRSLIVTQKNADEASLVDNINILPAKSLLDVCAHLTGRQLLNPYKFVPEIKADPQLDLSDVRGQYHAKRALEIAASGQHGMLMIGPPGSGKTMLASRLAGILPAMSEDESLETAAIYSVCDKPFDFNQWRKRPFRSPHHTTSSVALVGGSNPPKPGEVSLAHNGVLFLDEFPEFNRHVLEVLREPMESGNVNISRASNQAEFPAKFQLVAAMNPCPCGYFGDNKGRCRCAPKQIQAYRAKISGPLLDRIDLHIEVPALPRGVLSGLDNAIIETSAEVRNRVITARQKQFNRAGKVNAYLSNKEIENMCKIELADKHFLEDTIEKLNLSARAYHRILKIARTIADIDHCDDIQNVHLIEAVGYRRGLGGDVGEKFVY